VRGRIIFVGNFWDYFIKAVGLFVLTLITFGLLLPYFAYWSVQYFVSHLEIEMYPEVAPQPAQRPSTRQPMRRGV
jgi:uncharacterized membrane protein YjgN (DUF898 family)